MLSLYKTLVRLHVEYCSSVWNPYYSKDKQLLEHAIMPCCPVLLSLYCYCFLNEINGDGDGDFRYADDAVLSLKHQNCVFTNALSSCDIFIVIL